MKQRHDRGLARVLTSLLAAAALSAAAWPQAGAWREDFEHVEVGSLPAGWQRQIVPPGSTIGVQRAARSGKPDNKALAAADRRSDKQLIVYAPFPAIRGIVAAEVDFMLDGRTLSPVSCFYFGSPSAPSAISVAAFGRGHAEGRARKRVQAHRAVHAGHVASPHVHRGPGAAAVARPHRRRARDHRAVPASHGRVLARAVQLTYFGQQCDRVVRQHRGAAGAAGGGRDHGQGAQGKGGR